MLEGLEQKEGNERKRQEKNRSETEAFKNQLMKKLNDDELISDPEANNSTDNSSERKDEIETGSIDGNFEAAFYCLD